MPLTRPVRISGDLRTRLHPRYQHDVKILLCALDAMCPFDREQMMLLIEWTVQARKARKWGWIAERHASYPPDPPIEPPEAHILGEAV